MPSIQQPSEQKQQPTSTRMSHKPRILCLHGGGVSARIFKQQMRCFTKSLEAHFRLVFADGPYDSDMHDDLKPVYGGQGRCHRWARWLPHHEPLDNESAIEDIEDSLTAAMDKDEGRGEWVGLLGFSQGAKLAFSILLENQLRRDHDPYAVGFAGVQWGFGIIMAGRVPPYSLSDKTSENLSFQPPGELPAYDNDYAVPSYWDRLRTPTLHVHGLRDGGLELHRALLEDFCRVGSARCVEWEGAHRIPFKGADVKLVTDGIVKTAKIAQTMQ